MRNIYLLYRFLLTPKQQDLFERIALYCDQFTNTNFIPISFVLGKSDWTGSFLNQSNPHINHYNFYFWLQVSMWLWPSIDGGVSTPASRCPMTWWWWFLETSTEQMRGVVCCDAHSWDTPTYLQFLFYAPLAQECTSVSQLWSTLWKLVSTESMKLFTFTT